MLVFWKKKLVLFAVPKTGTTALEAALTPFADSAILNPPGMKHCTVKKYEREISAFFEQKGKRPLERMAIVRNPFDWLGSWYRYRARPELFGHENSTENLSFDQFVDAWLEDAPPAFAQVGQQAKFLDVKRGKARVDHLYCYEALPKAVAFLEDRLDKSLQLEARNVSLKADLALSPVLRDRVEQERPQEFQVWQQAQ